MVAAIYARKSTDQKYIGDEHKSITRQVEHAKAYARDKGWTVATDHIYIDDGISGAEFANRPGFLRLMNALRPTPPFQVLIMSEEARLGREAIETAYAVKGGAKLDHDGGGKLDQLRRRGGVAESGCADGLEWSLGTPSGRAQTE